MKRRPKARILVIEDDLSILHGLLDVLVFNGYDPTGVEDGAEGLKLALGQDFDLIILDLMIPAGGGFSYIRSVTGDSIGDACDCEADFNCNGRVDATMS